MSERALQPVGAATPETRIDAPRFLTRLESTTLGMIAVTVSIVWYEQWRSTLIGIPGARDMTAFAPFVLLTVLVIADLRRAAVAVAGVILLLAALLALDAGVASLLGNHDGSPGASLAIVLQLPIFIACYRRAQKGRPELPAPLLRKRMMLAVPVGAAIWLLVGWTLAGPA